MDNVRVAIYGVGAIGTNIAKFVLRKRGIEIVAAVDISPEKVGKDLGEILGLEEKLGVVVSSDASEVLSKSKPDVTLHATGSFLDKVYPQIVEIVEAGSNVISTCETLAYPYYRYPELSEKLDKLAKERGVTVLGSGVNPGFICDTLVATLTGVCETVEEIRAVRSLDAAKRRYPFQKKIGLGLSPEEFKRKLDVGEITAHVGYAESIMLVAKALGWRIDKVEEIQEPVIAEKDLETQYFKVKPGEVAGVRGFGIGYMDGREVIRVELVAAVGAEDYEEIIIEGNPNLHWRNSLGIPGDIATVAMIVNMVPRVLKARPGLLTMIDLPPPSAVLGDFRDLVKKNV